MHKITREPGIDYIGITTPFYCNDGKGNFLFHKRSLNCRDEYGKWDTGSGQLDYGLTLEENVFKEVKEEYGCDGVIQEQLPAHTILRTWKGQQSHWVAIPFFVRVDPKQARINEPDKIDKIKWFTLDHLPDNLHTGFVYTFNTYKQYFDQYQRMRK